MSTETLQERQIFGIEEQNLLTPNRPPISRLSISSFVLGIVSSIALFNLDLLALPILSAALGLSAYLLTLKNEAVRGQTLALVGMALSIVFAMACYTSNRQRDIYIYKEGAKVATQFLSVVGRKKLLEAYELTRAEPERQVAGTSLEEAYQAAAQTVKENIDGFKNGDGVQKVVGLGPSAQWELDKPLRVYEVDQGGLQISLQMIDRKSQKTVEVSLNRSYLAGIGSWNVMSLK